MVIVEKIRNRVGQLLADLEFPILIFPVMVVGIVATTFLFPEGRCGAWQWWTAVTGTIFFCLVRTGMKRGFVVSVVFLLGLAGVWLATQVIQVRCFCDILGYHNPATRMMIEGWNPVWHGTFDGMCMAVGIPLESIWPYHVIGMPKGPWYFCAAAYFFTGNPYNLVFPIMPFLFFGTMYAVLLVLRQQLYSWWGVGIAVSIIIFFMPGDSAVDMAVTLGGMGLLTSFYDYFKSGRWNWLRLMVFTFWMAVSKQTGMFHCGVFWILFIFVILFRKDWMCLRRIVLVGLISVFLIGPVVVSPYLTSLVNFGHPLYPQYSGDEQNFPAVHITNDFFRRNEDAAAMGHVGAYLNAYVSSFAMRVYYEYKLGKKNFAPDAAPWRQHKHDKGTPTNGWFKIVFCVSILVLATLGGMGGKIVALCVVAGTLAVPTEMVGYVRYTPYYFYPIVFCIPVVFYALRKYRWVIQTASGVGIIGLLIVPLIHLAYCIDDSYAISYLSRKARPISVIPFDGNPGAPLDGAKFRFHFTGNLMLLKRKSKMLSNATIETNLDVIRQSPHERMINFPGNGFLVSANSGVLDCSAHTRLFLLDTQRKRWMAMPTFVLRTLFLTLPKNIWITLFG